MDVSELLIEVEPLPPDMRIEEVGELFLSEHHHNYLSLPVVGAEGRPMGVVSRYRLMNVFLARYGREIHGRKPVTELMNPRPLSVEAGHSLQDAAQHIAAHMPFPLTEDFIICRDGRYAGIGIVLDLLRAMEDQLGLRNRELAKAYRHLKSSQMQLIQSEKMASLGQMVAGVAHEINTPLGYARNNLELARAGLEQARELIAAYARLVALLTADNVTERDLNDALGQVADLSEAFGGLGEEMGALFDDTLYGLDQIADLVRNLKNFSRLDQAMVDDIDLNAALDSALKIAHNAIKHKLTVVKRYGEIPRIRCAPSQINQVFLNMIVNAGQAVEGSGKLLLKTYAEDGHVHVVIQDNGRGIAREHLARIFDPFFTTKPVGEGTGLGLSISYQIIRQHGGEIRVASQPGRGTRFLIRLPCHRAVALRKTG